MSQRLTQSFAFRDDVLHELASECLKSHVEVISSSLLLTAFKMFTEMNRCKRR
jgi:hypothetical protein